MVPRGPNDAKTRHLGSLLVNTKKNRNIEKKNPLPRAQATHWARSEFLSSQPSNKKPFSCCQYKQQI